jgi:putative hydrolase of the HAD superfamily
MRAGEAWIFDLDNTLHDASAHVMPCIDRAMTRYICEHLSMNETEANALRKTYWQRYGATLLGLMRHHRTDPGHFLWHTHQFADLPGVLRAEPGLRAALLRLSGRKFVFSNAPLHYALAVLDALGIMHVFEHVHTIEHTRYRPKPDAYGFLRLARARHLRPRDCIMVEDNLENLRTAKRLGMRTVWIAAHARRAPGYVDRRVTSLAELAA